MGGPGAGHKSVEATQARLVNIQKARAARRRAPLPWRSAVESRIIEQLVWQWFLEVGCWRLEAGKRRKDSGEWLVASAEKKQKQIPHRRSPKAGDRVRDDNVRNSGERKTQSKEQRAGTPRIIAQRQNRPWSKLRVARLLGVSHTWVNKLVKQFERDPDRFRRRMAAFAPASVEKLERAREETRRLRERGDVRGPIRYRRVKVTLEGRKQKVVAANQSEKQRRAAEAKAPANLERMLMMTPMQYAELPAWARGFIVPVPPLVLPPVLSPALPRATQSPAARMSTTAGTLVATLPPAMLPPANERTPRPVKFARRHYRRR